MPPSRDEAIRLHACFLAQDYLAGRVARETLLLELCQLCIDTDYRGDLRPFFILRFAYWDLQEGTFAYHRHDVTRENFDEKLREEIEKLLAIAPRPLTN